MKSVIAASMLALSVAACGRTPSPPPVSPNQAGRVIRDCLIAKNYDCIADSFVYASKRPEQVRSDREALIILMKTVVDRLGPFRAGSDRPSPNEYVTVDLTAGDPRLWPAEDMSTTVVEEPMASPGYPLVGLQAVLTLRGSSWRLVTLKVGLPSSGENREIIEKVMLSSVEALQASRRADPKK
jgi:hypothetical protein